MFPDKLVIDYCEGCASEIDVIQSLQKEIPYFLEWVQGDEEEPRFRVEDVEKVMIMTVDTSVDRLYDLDVWGVGLRVHLKSGKYFLLYMPMYYETIFEEVFSYWVEVNESIVLVDADTDVNTLPQMNQWRTNLFKYDGSQETFTWTKA